MEGGEKTPPRRAETIALLAQSLSPAEIARVQGCRVGNVQRRIDAAIVAGEIEDEAVDDGLTQMERPRRACAAHLCDLRREHGDGARFEMALAPSRRAPRFVAYGDSEAFWPRQALPEGRR